MNQDDEIFNIYNPHLFKVDDFDVLLHEILNQTRKILNCEAGSIYISEAESLAFNVFQNDMMSYEDIYKQYYTLKDLKLPLSEHEKYLAVKSYVTNKTIIIDDVYESKTYDFLGVKEFDERFSYRTKSIITAPIIHPIEKKKLGVIQLLNKKDKDETIFFNENDSNLLSMAASFIGISIYKAQDDIEKLKKVNEKLKISNFELKKRVENVVSESEKKSAIIFHQSKLASLGEMLGNIAHQWRQPLSTISTIASGVSFNIELGEYNESKTINDLRKIVDTTKHLSQTIDDFRNFFKKDKREKRFNLSKNILQSIDITEASLSIANIEVYTKLDETLEIYSYENELKQAFLNIIQNAKDALIENLTSQERKLIFINLFKNEENIIVEIKDNAHGIPEKYLEEIFDQGFTTKIENGGTGVGLYMSKEIIENHMDGIIKASTTEYKFENQNYKGALFTIIFSQDSNKNL